MSTQDTHKFVGYKIYVEEVWERVENENIMRLPIQDIKQIYSQIVPSIDIHAFVININVMSNPASKK